MSLTTRLYRCKRRVYFVQRVSACRSTVDQVGQSGVDKDLNLCSRKAASSALAVETYRDEIVRKYRIDRCDVG